MSSHPPPACPTVARLKVLGDGRSIAPPQLGAAVAVGGAVRRALLKLSDGLAVFAGKAPDGQRLSGHGHLHVFSEAIGPDFTITHISLWAPMGFDAPAQQAIAALTKIWSNDQPSFDFELTLLGLGHPVDFGGPHPRAGHCLPMAQATQWRSLTPFIPTRHPKTFKDGRPKMEEVAPARRALQIGSPTHDLVRLLTAGGHPAPVEIAPLEAIAWANNTLPWQQFLLHRPRGDGRRAGAHGFGFQLTFAQPVRGPICIGYSAHAGLGLFIPS